MSKFGEAFKKAKAAGKKVFSFGGKSYNTKEEKTVSTPDKGPVPKSKPKAKKSTPSGAKGGVSKAEPKKAVPATGRDRYGPAKAGNTDKKAKKKVVGSGGPVGSGKSPVGSGKKVSGSGGFVGTRKKKK